MTLADINLSKERNDPQHLNWLAVGDALRILCDGLREYAKKEMQGFHSLMLNKLSGFALCTCPSGTGKKRTHVNSCLWARELEKWHCITKKSRIPWHQSDSSKWQDPKDGYWEIAKLYMSDLGSDSSKVKDPYSTDPTGLLNLLYFCTYLKVQQKLVQSVRYRRNEWAHAVLQKISDLEKNTAIQAILDLMNDVKLLACKAVQDCRPAIKKARDVNVLILKENELHILNMYYRIKEIELAIEKDRKDSQKEDEEQWDICSKITWLMMIICSPVRINPSGLKYIGFILFVIIFSIWIHIKDKSSLPSDNACPRAHEKSPISQYGFQEFNFSSYLNDKRSNFFGREWLFKQLENIFGNESSPLGVLITGEPGVGKSALMAQLICSPSSSLFIHNNTIAYHMCDYAEKGKRSGAMFVRNLVDQIAIRFPEYADYISSDKQVQDQLDKRCISDPVGCFQNTILGPLKDLKNLPDGIRYILIDALDECFEEDKKSSEILDILSNKILRFPNWLKVIISSRNWTTVTTKLPRVVDRISLEPTDDRNIEDIRSYIFHFLSQNSFFVDRLLEAMGLRSSEGINSLVNEMSIKSEGNFLFVKTTLEYLNLTQGSINLDSIPKRLYDTYTIFFKRQFGENNFDRFKVLFEVLLAASSPLKDKEIAAILNLYDPVMYTKSFSFQLLREVSSFLHYGQDGTISIYHKSFADWLMDHTSPDDSGVIYVNMSSGHQCIADYLIGVIAKKNTTPVLKELTDLAVHVSSGGMTERHVTKMKSFNISKIRDACGRTILHDLAGKDGKVTIFDTFIRMFQSADVLDHAGHTPAFYAAFKGNVENLKTLINYGINLDHRTQNVPIVMHAGLLEHIILKNLGWAWVDYSVLHIAACEGHVDIVNLLIENGASVIAPNLFGLTPFHLAAKNGHLDIVKLLYRHGAKADSIALHHAAAENQINVVRFLLKTAGVKDLCLSCNWENITGITNINATIQDIHAFFCETALHAAVSRQHYEIVKLLMPFTRTALDCTHTSGKTPLMVAVEHNDTTMVTLLLDGGASVESKCPTNTISRLTVKEELCNLPSRAQERLLYSLHCDREDCSCGERAIHLSAKYDLWEIAEELIDWDADIEARNCVNQNAMDIALCRDHTEFFVNLNRTFFTMTQYRFFTVPRTILRLTVPGGCINMLVMFLKSANTFRNMVEASDKQFLVRSAAEWSPYEQQGTMNKHRFLPGSILSYISRYSLANLGHILKEETKRRLAILKLLTETQRDISKFVNMRDENGKIYLHYAAAAGFADAVKYLVDCGSDWKAKDKEGNTPLTLALDETPKDPVRFETHYTFEDEKAPMICNTTSYDETVAYLISLHRSSLNQCNLASVQILNKVIDKQMPLSFYQLLKNGVDINCRINDHPRPLMRHLKQFGRAEEHVSEILRIFMINVTVRCGSSWLESELHFMSYLSNAAVFFKALNKEHFSGLQWFDSINRELVMKLNKCYDSEGYLAVHRAALGGNADAIDFFITLGIKLFKRTRQEGLTSLDISVYCLEKTMSSFIYLNVEFNVTKIMQDNISHDINIKEHRQTEPVIDAEIKQHAQIIEPSQRILIFRKLLVASCKANRSRCLSWCDLKFTRLSPLHFAASRGMGIFEFVYKEIRKIIPSLRRNCTNKHGIEPLYLAEIYRPNVVQQCNPNIETLPLQLSDTNVRHLDRYPDREAEYHIIYNHCFKTPELKFHESDIGDAVHCPMFHDLIPGRAILVEKVRQCSSACWVFTSHVYNHSQNALPFNAQQWQQNDGKDEWRPKINLMLKLVYYSEKNNFSSRLKKKISEALLCSRECRCTYLMMVLQRALTTQLKHDGFINMFIAERMGWKWKGASLDCENRDRWPFSFLFKKALTKYNSYSYLRALNSGKDISWDYFFPGAKIDGDEEKNMNDDINDDE